MDEKTFDKLEYFKILDLLANYCAFEPSVEKARSLRPTNDLYEAKNRIATTSEAVDLLATHPDMSIGGARDVRKAVNLAQHGGVLEPGELLNVKYTLIAARNLSRSFERLTNQYPHLVDLTQQFPTAMGLIDAVTRSISDRGEILDNASDHLAVIRREMRIVHDRLLTKMQRMVTDSKYSMFLQEPIVTQRDGRYVLPLRSEFKGRIRSIVHDQSASGATLFVEPLSVVDQNNQYRELILDEQNEERRILTDLSNLVGEKAFELDQTINLISELDLAFARAKYAYDLNATAPDLVSIAKKNKAVKSRRKPGGPNTDDQDTTDLGGGRHPGTRIRLYQARHPLLDPDAVVPIDVELDPETYVLVITGPNTGGKTVTLKTVGLLVLMAQAGMHIPVQSGSEISIFENVFADIGDEQSIEQSLSTFSSHITNIIRILKQADNRCLVILDELGAGTDPQEGAALARSLLMHLVERSITTIVTTHHPELKIFAHSTEGVLNASVQFDLDTLKPTYHLTIGLPGRSNALAIAQRLGLPLEIVDAARSDLDPDDLQAEKLIDEIHRQYELSRENRRMAEEARLEVEQLRYELIERLDKIEDERRKILFQAKEEIDNKIQAIGEEISEVRRKLKRASQPIEAIQVLEKQVDELNASFEHRIELQEPLLDSEIRELESYTDRPLKLGDEVKLKALNKSGVITALTQDEAEVQVGNLRVRTRRSELAPERSTQSELDVTHEYSISTTVDTKFDHYESPGIELDLRGKRADEALEALDRYLDAAYIARLPYVRIIHGKGTGKLRSVVRQVLLEHPHVKSFEGGSEKEGGEGVTIAKL